MKKMACLYYRFVIILFLAAMSAFFPAFAEPVRNGNELALSYTTNNMAGKIALSKSATGIFHAFRYLKVTEIKLDTPRAGAATLMAVEPSSALIIKMIVTAPLSVEKARDLRPGECVAGKGRIKSLGTEEKNLLVLDPAVISHKDREAPKLTKELLREIDPSAY